VKREKKEVEQKISSHGCSLFVNLQGKIGKGQNRGGGQEHKQAFETMQSNSVLDMLINSCGPWVSATDRRHDMPQGLVWRRCVSKQQPCMADKMRVFGLKWLKTKQNYTQSNPHCWFEKCSTRLER